MKHLFYCKIQFAVKSIRFLRKPVIVEDYRTRVNLGYSYGEESVVREKMEERVKQYINENGTFGYDNREIVSIKLLVEIANDGVSFETIKMSLPVLEFIHYCKDNFLPLEVIVK
jgi:hypothetical protein